MPTVDLEMAALVRARGVHDEKWANAGSETPIKGKCGAKLQGRNRYCVAKPAMRKGQGQARRCRRHGGMSLRGADHPRWIDGRRTEKFTPKGRLAFAYRRALLNPELTSMHDEIAMIDGRAAELVAALGQVGCAAAWRAVVRECAAAVSCTTDEARVRCLQILQRSIEAGASVSQSWDDLLSLWESRRKIAETESKRLQALDQTMTMAEAYGLLHQMAESVRQHVTDQRTLHAIGMDFARIVGPRHRGGSTPIHEEGDGG